MDRGDYEEDLEEEKLLVKGKFYSNFIRNLVQIELKLF